jgi:C-terminal processing protease CtpA/Prc
VVGTRSYGKGTVQELRRLPGGAVLQLTVAQYLTPNGAVVDGRGISPQLEAEAAEGTFGTDEDHVIEIARQALLPRIGFHLLPRRMPAAAVAA